MLAEVTVSRHSTLYTRSTPVMMSMKPAWNANMPETHRAQPSRSKTGCAVVFKKGV